MSSFLRRILTVGLSECTGTVLGRLARKGWEYHVAPTLQDAGAAVRSGNFGIILATEVLADGCGYDLVESVAGVGGTLYVAIALSEGYLWLPVVERGTRTPGNCGLDPRILESEIEELAANYGQRMSLWQESGAVDRSKPKPPKPVEPKPRLNRESALDFGHGWPSGPEAASGS